MILCEEIEVPLTGKNIPYYESLGYNIPREKVPGRNFRFTVPRGTKIIVRISDLLDGSNIKIPCKCDYCGEEFEKKYIEILRDRNDGVNKDSCGSHECSEKRKKDALVAKYGTSDLKGVHEVTGTHLGRYLKYTKDDYVELFKSKHREICFDMIDDFSHIRTKDNIPFICKNHPDKGVQYASYDSSRYSKHCCQFGAYEATANQTRKASIQDVIDICKERNYTLLTDEIKSVDDKIEYVCNIHPDYGVQATTLYGMQHYDDNCKLCVVAKSSSGNNHWNWRGGINDANDSIRKSWEYKDWRALVYERDSFTCKRCGASNVELNAHHVLNFSSNEDLRFDINNGITLCKKCHKLFHSRYGTKNNTRKQLNEFIADIDRPP